ncbi:NDUFAF6 [Mytilus coruscus]|uniref:NDUFAF6 n=1 Tax=Mytilus coruscus TaxID=42192 RepID=A0A6J8EB66_MYTCO|nr:NDUFAF6 [Mytilus coruscus]
MIADRQMTQKMYKVFYLSFYNSFTVFGLTLNVRRIAGITDKQVHHVASHIGKSQGVVTLLRGLPYNSSKGRIYLPRESLLKFKISGEDVMRGRKQKEICDIVLEVASVAKQHLETARSMKKDVPSTVLPLFLNSIICDKYLKQLQKVDFNVFHPSLQKKNGLLPLQLLLQKIGKKY